MIALSFTDQLQDTICVDSYSLHLLHISISRVVFCRSTPGYQIVREVSVMNGRSSESGYQVRFSKSVRSFFFVVVIHNTHRQRRKSPPTKTFKRISHFTQPHVYSLVVTHGRENAKHTVYRTLTVRPEPEKENFTQFAEMLYMYLYARHLS